MAITILLIVKILFFASLAGIIFMLVSKIPRVRALEEAQLLGSGGPALSFDFQKIKSLGLAAPSKARQILSKEKERMAKQLSAAKSFSEQRIVYHFRKNKPTGEQTNTKIADSKNDCPVSPDDYWNKIQKQ